MKAKTIVVVFIVGLSIIATITNPKEEAHTKVISKKLVANESGIIKIFTELVYTAVNSYGLEYENYILFSLGEIETQSEIPLKSIGAFGNVIILNSDDELSKIRAYHNQVNKSSEKQMYKEQTKSLDDLINGN